jgi:glutaredoxin
MAAREAFAADGRDVAYHDVTRDPARLDEMLRLTRGSRRVPVIVDGDAVTIGHGGT